MGESPLPPSILEMLRALVPLQSEAGQGEGFQERFLAPVDENTWALVVKPYRPGDSVLVRMAPGDGGPPALQLAELVRLSGPWAVLADGSVVPRRAILGRLQGSIVVVPSEGGNGHE